MDAESAYEFLKPVLDQMDISEREKLKRLMFGEDEKLIPGNKKSKKELEKEKELKDIAIMKRKLLKTGLFKN
jgi:hypothetical protein